MIVLDTAVPLSQVEADYFGRLEAIGSLAREFSTDLADRSLVLYAGMNLPSPRAAAMLSLPLGAMPAMGQGLEREQPGVGRIAELEQMVEASACRLFSADWAETRLQSCTLANLAVYAAVCSPGDQIAITPASAGGHVSHQLRGAPGVRGLKTFDLPFSEVAQQVDDAAAADVIRLRRPKLVMLGASYVPKPFEFPLIVKAARHVGAIVAYDMAHIAGLVAGKVFPNPLDQGADLLTASTYKSLGGAPGGLILGRSTHPELENHLRRAVFPGLTANYDAARVAALGISLAESERFAVDYAQAMLDNARALAAALAARSMLVTPSETHHLVLPMDNADAVAHALAGKGIICGSIAVSGQPWPRGLRIGTQLITRKGMAPSDMPLIADLLQRAIADNDSDESLSQQVEAFVRRFATLHFC